MKLILLRISGLYVYSQFPRSSKTQPLIFMQIVDQKSATLGLPGSREIQVALDTNHENLCRFADCGGHDFEQVGENIQELAQKVIAVASRVASQNIGNCYKPQCGINYQTCVSNLSHSKIKESAIEDFNIA